MNIERLSESEELIISVIWESKEDLRGYDITEFVNEKFGKEWKFQTVLTFLDRMSKKGFVKSYKAKNSYRREYTFFQAKISKEEYLSARMKEINELWFDGNKEEMKIFVESLLE